MSREIRHLRVDHSRVQTEDNPYLVIPFSHNSIFGFFLAGFTAAAATAKTATGYDEQHNQQKRGRHRNAYSSVFIKPPANKACMKVKLADWYV